MENQENHYGIEHINPIRSFSEMVENICFFRNKNGFRVEHKISNPVCRAEHIKIFFYRGAEECSAFNNIGTQKNKQEQKINH